MTDASAAAGQQPQRITARDNPLLQRLRKLQHDGSAYRQLGQTWAEGAHLGQALAARGGRAAVAVVADSGWRDPALRRLAQQAARVVLLPDALMKTVSTLQTPALIGFVIDVATTTSAAAPAPAAAPASAAASTTASVDALAASIVLDRVQDAGNAGSMLRSAAAFGITQVLALRGTVALWSPKVLRAGMGAHFALRIVEAADGTALSALRVPLLATSSHGGTLLADATLPWPCAWVLGHEGQGVAADLLARCALQLRIPQPGGEESLNVAAAAAVCLYESARRRG